MTRIIAGTARGRRLRVPPDGTRPTSDRVRESMFASVDHELGGLAGRAVLDLFAGSGALGLEAASRGASTVVLVERDRAAAAVARANVAAVGAPGVRVVVTSVESFLAGPATPVDLVLADPPYALPAAELEAMLARLAAAWLVADGLVVVERPGRDGQFAWPAPLRALREKRYGTTTLWYGRLAPEGEDP